MGFTDKHNKEQIDKAFKNGEKAGKEGGLVDDVLHEIGKATGTVVPGATDESKARDAGYERGQKER